MTNTNEKGQFEPKYSLDEYTDLYDDYGGWITDNLDKQTTIDRLKAGVRAWLSWCEENDVDPYVATENDVRRYIKAIRGHADTTISRRVATVSKFCHFLLTDPDVTPHFDVNPTAGINLRKDYEIYQTAEYVNVIYDDDREDIIALEREQVEKLLDESKVPSSRPAYRTRDYLVNALFWQTALRADELSRVRVDSKSNFNFDKRQIKIRSSKLKKEENPELYHRRVWWEPNIDIYLRRWLDSHRERTQYGNSDNPYLFPGKPKEGEEQGHLNPGTLSRIVKKTAHNVDGMQEPLTRDADGDVKQWLVTAHRLRHSRITYLANEAGPDGEGMELNSLRMMAGHAKFDTTLSYVSTDWETARERFNAAIED